MSQSIIGSNAAIRYLDAYDAHINYWREINPAYQLAFIDNPEHTVYIEQYAQALPSAMVIARVYHPLDGGFHLAPTGAGDTRYYVSSPVEYLSAYGWLGRKRNIILNVFNEPNAIGTLDEMQRLTNWFTEYIPIAASSETKSVLFNWADRNPQIINGMFDSRFDDCLRLMAVHSDLFYMGMHFYGPDELVSHLDSYVARCNFLGIKPPRVIGTEFGIDSTGGVQRGYKTWPEYKDVYGQWQVAQVKGALAKHIQSGVLAGLTTFQEGNSGGFEDFDIENDTAYKTEIKRAYHAGEINAPTVTPPPSGGGTTPLPPVVPPVVTPPKPDPIVSPAPYVEISSAYAVQLATYYHGLADTWDKIAKGTKIP